MSVLSDVSLRAVYPDAEHVGPSSIDLHLGDTLLWWPDWVRRDPRIDQAFAWREESLQFLPESNSGVWVLTPGRRYLADTRETVAIRPDCCGQIAARSSWGRDGLAVIQGPAGWVDSGYRGRITLELAVVGSDLVIWPGARIAQLIVFRMTTPAEHPYDGKYQGDSGPAPSRFWKEWQEKSGG